MAKKKRINLILDTNWYVSASINRNSRRLLYNLLINENLTIYYALELLTEFEAVIQRKKFEKYIRQDQINRFVSLVLTRLHQVEIKTRVRLSRDAKDNFLLSMALDCGADYLITGDPDLLVLGEFGKTKILNMTEFMKILN